MRQRKGAEPVRLTDYLSDGLAPQLTIGLSWDVTAGVEIDLDASVIMLDASYKPLDIVFFGKLISAWTWTRTASLDVRVRVRWYTGS